MFSSSSQTRNFLTLAVILAVVFLAYFPVLKADFVLWDDDVHLFKNITLRGLDSEHLHDIFTSTVNKIYIPLTSLSFAVEYHYWGLNPFVYHLDNLLLHLAVVGCVFALGRRLGLSVLGAGVSALFFGIHPMRVESVAWVTERKDVLYAFFYLLAVLSYLRHLDRGGYRWLVLTTLLGVLSMLAKPMALSLPLILFLLDWFKGKPLRRRAVFEKLPLCLLIAAIGWGTYSTHIRLPGESVTTSILIWPWTFVFYLRQFLFPFFSVPVYRLPHPVNLANPEYWLSLLTLVFILFSLWRLRRYRWFLFAVLFYFLSIFFLLRFDDVKDTNIVADRFMYLPGLGFCLLGGLLVEQLWASKGRWGIPLAMGIGIFVAVCSATTYRRCFVWKDSISLWRHQLKFFPQERLALNNLATALREKEEYQAAEAEYRKVIRIKSGGFDLGYSPQVLATMEKVDYLIGLYKKAIEADPAYVDAHYNLANLYANIGMITEAAQAYIKTLSLDYTYKDAHFNLGNLYQEIGDYKQAIYAYEQTIATHPHEEDVYINVILDYNEALRKEPANTFYREAREKTLKRLRDLIQSRPPRATSFFNLGVVYRNMGDLNNAIFTYRNVLQLNPAHVYAMYELGSIYMDMKRFDEALSMYKRAVSLKPRLSDAFLNMGIIYGERKDYQKAEEYYGRALTADPANARAYFNLAYLNEISGNLRKAVGLYQNAGRLNPKNAEIYYNLGNAHAKLKMEDKAISSYLNAVQIDPEHMNAWVNLSILSFQKGDFVHAVKYCDEAVLLGYDAPVGYLKALEPYRHALDESSL